MHSVRRTPDALLFRSIITQYLKSEAFMGTRSTSLSALGLENKRAASRAIFKRCIRANPGG
jgi:hypothetical protein